jgi:hypothetical protein
LIAALVLCISSCGGDGVVSTVVGPPPVAAPKLTELQSAIFTPKCAIPGCHAPPAPEQGMNLSDGNTFTYTVGVNSTELSGFKRVLPGIGSDSYLYMKITADPRIVGERMPFGGMLTADEIEKVKAWIDAGALDN